MSQPLDVATLVHRDVGTYPEALTCLTCGKLVDPTNPHVFVRDADRTLSNEQALVGLLHVECEPRYVDQAQALGVQPPSE